MAYDGLAPGDPDLDGAQVLEVAGDRRLRGAHAVGGEQLDQVGLAGHRLLGEQAGDPVLALGLGERLGRRELRCHQPSSSRKRSEAPEGVQPVVGLREHAAAVAVDDGGRDLLAPVGGQAVQEHGAGGRRP